MYPGQNANGGMAENNFSGAPIIISDPTPLDNGKKSKKWVIVGVLIVLFIAFIAFVMVFTGSRKDSPTVPQNLSQINEELSKYSSTILYGDGRQVDLSTSAYSVSKEYMFMRKISVGDQEYIDLAIDEFSSIEDLINGENGPQLTEEEKNYLKSYKDRLQFIKTYISTLSNNPLTIFDRVAEYGVDETISYIESQYSKYIKSDNLSLREYFTYKAEYEKLAVEILPRININECIVDNSITPNCEIESIMTEEEALQMQGIQDEMRMIVDIDIKYIISGCWDIYNIINGVENV
jgi:hypothetical protein